MNNGYEYCSLIDSRKLFLMAGLWTVSGGKTVVNACHHTLTMTMRHHIALRNVSFNELILEGERDDRTNSYQLANQSDKQACKFST